MRNLQDAHELTYIVISHDLAVVRYLADTIGVMYLGKLVEIGPAADVYERTAHPYTRGLIDAVPVPDPVLEKAAGGRAVRGELPSPIDPPSGCRFRTRCPLAQESAPRSSRRSARSAATTGPPATSRCRVPAEELRSSAGAS